MTWEVIESLVVPEQLPSPVWHVLVAKRTRSHGVDDHRATAVAIDSEVYPQRDAVAKALDVLALAVTSEDAHANHRDLLAKQRLEISLNLFLLQIRHTAPTLYYRGHCSSPATPELAPNRFKITL